MGENQHDPGDPLGALWEAMRLPADGGELAARDAVVRWFVTAMDEARAASVAELRGRGRMIRRAVAGVGVATLLSAGAAAAATGHFPNPLSSSHPAFSPAHTNDGDAVGGSSAEPTTSTAGDVPTDGRSTDTPGGVAGMPAEKIADLCAQRVAAGATVPRNVQAQLDAAARKAAVTVDELCAVASAPADTSTTTAPGKSGEAPGQTGSTPSNSGAGKSGQDHGKNASTPSTTTAVGTTVSTKHEGKP